MAINFKQLSELVIKPTLETVDLYSFPAERLILGTAAAEGIIGNETFLKQQKGPALGIYQMEPETHDWLVDHAVYRMKNLKLLDWVNKTGGFDKNRLVYDLRYATLLCRLRYWVVPHRLPNPTDVQAMAIYWKQFYNTSVGKGTIDGFVEKFNAYVKI